MNERPHERKQSWILGVRVDDVTNAEAVDLVGGWIAAARVGGATRQLVTTNPEFVMAARRNRAFRRLLNMAALATPDGQGLLWASRLLRTHRLRQRAPGVELVEMLAAAAAEHDWCIYLLGAAPGVAEETARVLAERYPGFSAVGCYAGSPHPDEEVAICQQVRDSRADILLVAYGAPQQNFWIERNIAAGRLRSPLAVAIGVGGAFDFISGRTVRAPAWMRKLGLEWLHRLYKQPWRYRRILTVIYFGLRVLRRAFWQRLQRLQW